jgi:hypothetical protein
MDARAIVACVIMPSDGGLLDPVSARIAADFSTPIGANDDVDLTGIELDAENFRCPS